MQISPITSMKRQQSFGAGVKLEGGLSHKLAKAGFSRGRVSAVEDFFVRPSKDDGPVELANSGFNVFFGVKGPLIVGKPGFLGGILKRAHLEMKISSDLKPGQFRTGNIQTINGKPICITTDKGEVIKPPSGNIEASLRVLQDSLVG